jgi:hypothetical protein
MAAESPIVAVQIIADRANVLPFSGEAKLQQRTGWIENDSEDCSALMV